MLNPFAKFTTKTKKVKIKALGNTEVELREPTVIEIADFYKIMANSDGSMNIANFLEAKLERIATCLVSPTITVDELKALSSTASDAINEIYEASDLMISKDEGSVGN